MLHLIKLQALSVTKSNTPPWVLFKSFKLLNCTNGTKLEKSPPPAKSADFRTENNQHNKANFLTIMLKS